jgi:hypothetical protein
MVIEDDKTIEEMNSLAKSFRIAEQLAIDTHQLLEVFRPFPFCVTGDSTQRECSSGRHIKRLKAKVT